MSFSKLYLFLFIFISCGSEEIEIQPVPQDIKIDIEYITDLSSVISESSGLINFDGKLITHNDSGGNPQLYEIDKTTGDILRTVTITNAVNIDMEDIAQDKNYIYLCDIGNNSNSRKDLIIYKISKVEYLAKDRLEAKTISIRYKEQTDFSKTDESTNFDAEAVVSINDHLFLFTKNWGDLNTSVYKIPKEEGAYVLTKIDTYKMDGLITGAVYNEKSNTAMLIGYNSIIPFVVKLSNFSKDNPLNGFVQKKNIIVNGSVQIEGISLNPDGSYYLSAEKLNNSPAVLYRLIVVN